MRFLFCGDVVGRAGREAVISNVPDLRRRLGLDAVIVNGENAAHGFGINPKICEEFYAAGVDCITTGNHIWDQREIIGYIGKDPRLLRPVNYPKGTPGRGQVVLETAACGKILVINAMARLFMDPLDDPFAAVDAVLTAHPLGKAVQAVLVDFHGEATSEKMSMGHFCDGRASLVVGTHSHIPTADAQILPGGTSYQTDAGMCGDYDSVIGMRKDISLYRFETQLPGERYQPALGEGTLCGTFVETDDAKGLAKRVAPIRLGGRLSEVVPAA